MKSENPGNRLLEQNKPEMKPSITDRLVRIGRKTCVLVLGFGLAVVTAAGASACTPKPESSEPTDTWGHVDTTIEEVTIHKGAEICYDPIITDKYDVRDLIGGTNILEIADDTYDVGADDNIVVHPDGMNGEWYGVPVESLKQVDTDFNPKGDSDGLVWVNTHDADVLMHKQYPEDNSSTTITGAPDPPRTTRPTNR